MPRSLARLALAAALAVAAVPGRAAPVPLAGGSGLAAKLGPSLARRVVDRPDEPVAAWVYFTDRAGLEHDPSALAAAGRALSPRASARRAARGAPAGMMASDLPVHASYVDALISRGARLRGTSRWLDAASVEMPARLAVDLARLPFVARVELVPLARPITRVDAPEPAAIGGPAGTEPNAGGRGGARATATMSAPGDTAYYGGSFRQNAMMQVPQLHALGLSGAGVLVCMLDDGFTLTHAAFAGLNVIASRDFINGDTNVGFDPAQDAPGQGEHGTMTLGCVAASRPGTYTGAAFAAAVALGKTENDPTETPAEMDYWQFGAEWADSLGADVISSSLGYSDFDNPLDSYTYADMDGRTTVVTLAAVEAARRGITVVNAAGNEAALPWHYIIAPADADSIVSVGAVDSFNVVTSFSSRGPTADGRIKPDVTADGRRVLLVSPTDNSSYVRASGTSFATPLTAGVVALLLEAHPGWGPFEVREALRGTALNHAAPDNDIGWGLVQGLAARAWVPSNVDVAPAPLAAPGVELAAGPNPVRSGAGTLVWFAAPHAARATLDVLDLAGRRRARLFDGPAVSRQTLFWSGAGEDGDRLPAGVYWLRLETRGGEGVAARSTAAAPPRARALRVVVLP
jgi:serine protease AprX